MYKGKAPKFLVNWNEEGLDRLAVAKAVSNFLGLGKSEEALLCYYAQYDTGWQAAARVIESAATVKNVERTRAALAEKGVVCENDRVVLIDWRRLAGVAYAEELAHEKNESKSTHGKRQHRQKNLHKFTGLYEAKAELDDYCWRMMQTVDVASELTEEEQTKALEYGKRVTESKVTTNPTDYCYMGTQNVPEEELPF